MADTYSIGEIAARSDHLVVACSRCDRRGRLSLRRLVAQYGAAAPLGVVLRDISADCPRRTTDGGSWFNRCDPYCPEMVGLLRR